MSDSIYTRLGGEAAMNAAVDLFYRKVLQDQELSHFFDDTDMAGQAAKQKAFLTMALGGPNQYTGDDMRQTHREMSLSDDHFDAVVGHLGATLTELGVPADLIGEAAAVAESVRGEVLNRPTE